MKLKDFPNPKLEIKDFKHERYSRASFDSMNNYLETFHIYVRTNIELAQYKDTKVAVYAWILRLVSSLIYRSIFLRNTFVTEFNNGNYVGIFFPLKALFEVAGTLATILGALKANLPEDELQKRIVAHVLGNRGEGSLRVGSIEAVSVQTSIGKADKYFEEFVKNSTNSIDLKNYFSDYYDVLSNPTHPSYDAHDMVGNIDSSGKFMLYDPETISSRIYSDLQYYGGALHIPTWIRLLTEEILQEGKSLFDQIESKPFFDS